MKIKLSIIFLIFSLAVTNAQVSDNRNLGNQNESQKSLINENNTRPQNILASPKFKKNRVVELNVKVLSNQKAESYVAVFNLTQMGKTADETNTLLLDRFNGFAQDLQTIGIPKENIYLDMVRFLPLYEDEKGKKIFTKTHNEVPKGFEMQQNVHIKHNDSNFMGKIISAAARYEIFDLVKVDCSVSNQESIYIEMRKKAVSHLVKEIELYETELGLDLENGYKVVAENKKAVSPIDRYSWYNAISNVSLGGAPEKGKVLDMYKPKTMYYDKLKYDDYDIVDNPDILGPAIQFIYNLKIQIVIKEKDKPVKDYFWLTPDGDIIPVKMN
ncbi:MAG: SIMPL domain-containing protein [Saprospiraceae bacterium]|nr:SIMPL domain-containing protein [Saprospiraceae bacterium]